MSERKHSWRRVCAVGGIAILALMLGTRGDFPSPMNIRVNGLQEVLSLAWDHTIQAEPTIAVFQEIVLVAFVDTSHFLPQKMGLSSLTSYSRSTDGGVTFQDLGPVPPYKRSIGYSNPTLAVSSDGIFYLANIQQGPDGIRVGVARSDDGGQTFNPAILVPLPSGRSLAFSDLPQVAIDPEKSFIYIIWTDLLLRQVLFSRSTDGGQTFSLPMALSSGPAPKHMARLASGPNGLLYALWLEDGRTPAGSSPSQQLGVEALLPCPAEQIYLSRSLDYGLSWSPGRPIITFRIPCSPQNPLECQPGVKGSIKTPHIPSPAVDPRTGLLHIAFQSAGADGSDNSDIFFMTLDPELNLLIPPKRVNDVTSNDQFMPALAVSPQGEIGIMFYDRRLDPNNELIDIFFARSTNGGLTFTNERVTSVSFPRPPITGQPTETGNFDDLRRACYIGDYNSIVADTCFFYLVWGDSRNIIRTFRYPEGRPDLDVYFSRIPLRLENGCDK